MSVASATATCTHAQHVATATRSEHRKALAHPIWQLQLRDAHSRSAFTSLALGLQPEGFRNLLFIGPSDHDPTDSQRPPSDIEDEDDDDATQADEDSDIENSGPNTSTPRAVGNPNSQKHREAPTNLRSAMRQIVHKYPTAHRPRSARDATRRHVTFAPTAIADLAAYPSFPPAKQSWQGEPWWQGRAGKSCEHYWCRLQQWWQQQRG